MTDITPDMVARVASKLFNQTPNSDGMARPDATPPASSPKGPGLPPVIGGQPTPTTPGSFPGASGVSPTVPSSPPLSGLPFHLPQTPFHTPVPPPMTPEAPTAPALPQSFGLPYSPPITPVSAPHSSFSFGMPAAFPNATAPQPTNTDGLRGFVQGIRQPQPVGRNQTCLDPTRSRDKMYDGRALNPGSSRAFDVNAIRRDFPVLHQEIHGKPLAWFDNAATTQKPQSVIDAISNFYERDNSNIHRAAHTLAARATEAYEQAREKVQRFLGASTPKEIVFVRGTTEGMNLIAQTFGRKFLRSGDEIVLSPFEHHAGIVPWQMIAKETGAVIRVIPVTDRGEIMLEEYERLLGPRTKVVSITHASNSLGTVLPIEAMTKSAKRYNARVVIDGAQSVAHIPVNMQSLGADFFVFSGHKIFGPTGIGAVYIRDELHEMLPPWQGGGNMIRDVTFEETRYSEAPAKFEAGTPNIADAVGLGAALDYVSRLGLPNIAAYEHELLHYATEKLTRIDGLRLIGTAREKVGVMSFTLPNRKTEEIGRLLDQEGIAVRSGHHCSQPSLRRMGVETTVRPSLSLYNTHGEIDRLVDAVKRIRQMG